MVSGEHVEEAVSETAAVLTPQVDVDWQVRAASLDRAALS